MKKILPLALVSVFLTVAALLTAHKQSPSRESLLPALRVVQQHQKQADRAISGVIPLSPEEERRVGREIDARMGGPVVIVGNPRDILVMELGRQLSTAPGVTRFPGIYEFRVLHGSIAVNAFAIPGGFVYVTEGLLRRFPSTDPDALLFVLGHEIGHIELGHCADGYRTREWFKKSGMGGLGNAAGALRGLAQLQFSEVQELEADAFGARLVKAVGRKPEAALRAMDYLGLNETLDTDTKRHPGQVAAEGLLDYFRTHPGSWERRNRLKQEIERMGS